VSNLKNQIEDSKRAIRRNKKVTPWIYEEYIDMNAAKFRFELAKEEYLQAKKAWQELGQ
jgi:hypothetical protein